jgi:hypothetical protein
MRHVIFIRRDIRTLTTTLPAMLVVQ